MRLPLWIRSPEDLGVSAEDLHNFYHGLRYEVCYQYWTVFSSKSRLLSVFIWWLRELLLGANASTLEVYSNEHYIGQLRGWNGYRSSVRSLLTNGG
jgi:hypothetical protein